MIFNRSTTSSCSTRTWDMIASGSPSMRADMAENAEPISPRSCRICPVRSSTLAGNSSSRATRSSKLSTLRSIVCGLTTPPDPPQHTGARRHRSAVGIALCMFAQGRPERRRLPRGRRTTLPSSATTFNGVSPVRRGSFDLRQRSAAGSIEPDRVSGPLTDIDDGASREARDDETWPGRLRNNVTRGATDHASPSRLVDEIPDFYQAAIDAKPNPPVRVGRDLLFNDGAAVEPYDERLAATVHDEALRSSKADVLGELFSIQSERQQTRCRTRWVSSTQWNHVAAGTIRGNLSTQ